RGPDESVDDPCGDDDVHERAEVRPQGRGLPHDQAGHTAHDALRHRVRTAPDLPAAGHLADQRRDAPGLGVELHRLHRGCPLRPVQTSGGADGSTTTEIDVEASSSSPVRSLATFTPPLTSHRTTPPTIAA